MQIGRAVVVAVVGATGTGKSELALDIAEALDAEIINADSMQVYRGMDVGTAKVPTQHRRAVPHHLLDIWDVTQPANVADYQRLAREAIEGITSRGKSAVVVGGSGLYVRAIFDDLQFPGADPDIRRRLQEESAMLGAAAMHARLANLDPDAASAILPSNERRIIRALEVIELTGSRFTASLPPQSPRIPACHIGLRMDRQHLDARLDARVDAMWDEGFVDEVVHLVEQGLREGVTARQALGYAQILGYLDGHWDEKHARERTKSATRRFARRQESWFGRETQIEWVDASSAGTLASAMAAIQMWAVTGPSPA